MPKFRVNDPESGRALLMEGETPPSEQEIEEAFRSVTQQATSFRDLSAQQPLSLRAPAAPFLPTGRTSTTVGGPPVSVPPGALRSTMAEVGEELTTPTITAPKFKPIEGEPAAVTVGKEAANILIGIPEFMTSKAGVTSLAVAPAAPATVAGLFTADMLYGLGQQVLSSYKNWQRLSPTQKRVVVTDMVGSGLLATLTGAATARAALPKPQIEPAPTIETPIVAQIDAIYMPPRINLGGRLAAIARAKTMLPRAAAQAEREVADAVSQRTLAESDIRKYKETSEGGLPERARPGGGDSLQPGAAEPQVQAGVQPAEVSEAGRQRVLVGNRPAVKTMPDEAGKFTYVEAQRLPTGEWETHDQIIERVGLKTDQIDRRVFLDEQGREKPREQTAQELAALGEPTKVPGEAHSTDVNRLASELKSKGYSTAIIREILESKRVSAEVPRSEKPIVVAAKRTKDGEIIYAREHRALQAELTPGENGFLVLPPNTDPMLVEHDALRLSLQHQKDLGAQFVSIPEAQAAKGDIEAAAAAKAVEQAPPAAATPPAPPVEKPAAVTEAPDLMSDLAARRPTGKAAGIRWDIRHNRVSGLKAKELYRQVGSNEAVIEINGQRFVIDNLARLKAAGIETDYTQRQVTPSSVKTLGDWNKYIAKYPKLGPEDFGAVGVEKIAGEGVTRLKPEAPKSDVARLVQEDASKKVPEARETLDAHETVPTELAGKPASLGKWLTRTARPSEKAPETQTSRLTTLQSPDNQRVAVVSTYDHPRYGAMLFDPNGGTKHVALTTLLKQGWKPIASTLTKEPHSRFRKVFGSMEAYQSEVGQPLAEAKAALKTYPAPTQVTQPSLPLGPETIRDPMLLHLMAHPTLNDALAAIQTAPNRRQLQAIIRSAMDDLQQKNPKLTDEQAAEQVLNTFYEQSRRPRPASEPGTAPTVGAAAPSEPTTEAPKATVAEPAPESPHGVRLDVTTPAEHPLGPIDTATTPTLSLWQNLSGELKEAAAGLRAFWRAFAMQALPKISTENRVAGEAGVRYDASRRIARTKGIEFAGKVTEGVSDRTFDKKFGTALVEDNLRSIRQGFRGEGNTEAADAVTTLIGARNSPFATEAQYQAFLNNPQTQRVIQRHKQLWDEQKDPIYRKANDLDPDLELETRGLQTGARINLKAVLPSDTTRTAIGGTGRPSLIRQAVTRLRRDPFARQAKGTGQVYEGSYQEIMASGFEREYPIAAQHEFIKQLVDSGLAKVTQQEFPKELTVRGERPKAYELKIRPWRNYWIQVPRSLAPEFENVMGLTPSWQVPGVRHLSDFLTSASVQGFAEGSTHVANLSTGILTGLGPTANPMLNALIKSVGRADILYQLPRILIRGFAKNQSEMLRLAEIGAAKEPYTGLLGWFINRIDRGVRLVSADTYREMAAKGWVVDTETGLREYVNQVGQYSKRLQPAVIARLRETGIQPFATAAHTFNVMGLRTLGFGPAAKSPTWYGALALRADKAGGLMGFIVLTAALNKLLSGNASGPPGTQLGNVGWRDDQGKVKQFPLARLFGYERGPRITGLQSFAEARRLGLPEATALSSSLRSIGGTGISYVSGPMVQFATKAITGKRPGVPMVQEAKVVPPPSEDELQPFKTQAAANIAAALQQANPAIDASLMVLQGKELPEILRRQFSRYTPRPGMSEATIEAMPKIVHSKQMFDYASALAKEARKQPRGERNDFINKRLEEDDVTGKDRAEAMRLLKLKGVFRYE